MPVISKLQLTLTLVFLLSACSTDFPSQDVRGGETETLLPTLQGATPAEVLSDFSENCGRFDETVYNEFIKTYDGNSCKLALLSPDEKHLAYVTLMFQKYSDTSYYVDVVKVKSLDEDIVEKNIHIVRNRNYVLELEWSTGGDELLVWEKVWEGPVVLSIYNSHTGSLVARMKANEPVLHWNAQKTAFYVVHEGDYGKEVCVMDLFGYDFESNFSFPNMLDIFGLEEKKIDMFGIPYPLGDALRVSPYGWSANGDELLITVTRLELQGEDANEYVLKPTEAGVLQLSDREVKYSMLRADSDHDYFFDTNDEERLVSRPYSIEICP